MIFLVDWFSSEGEERFQLAEETRNRAPLGTALFKSGKVPTTATSASENSSLSCCFFVLLEPEPWKIG